MTTQVSETMAVRILLVDDDSLDRRLLKQTLAAYPDMDLVGEASSGDEAISAVDRLHPDIVLMDIRMPTMDGITATREIKATYPNVKVIGLSDYAEGYSAMEKAGAVGVYPKSRATEKLYSAIKKSQLDLAI